MTRSTRLLALVCLAAGALLGYMTATGKFHLLPTTEARAPSASQAGPSIAGKIGCCMPQEGQDEVLDIEILLPGDAVLEIEGVKMESTGEIRHFQTPPLARTGHYTYTVKATHKGKEVSKKVSLVHGAANSFDLRPDFLVAGAKPERTTIASKPAQAKKPNILFIMGDDIGMWNIGAYHRGLMAGRTPNLDKLAKQGMLFTDYYAEASCTAGRANFIMGQLPIRTGMTTVGQAGAKTGIPKEACTIATALKAQGYATGQFGKNHLGDLNEFLPTLHGFDEFFGYLYHLDAMEDPAHPNYPQELLNVVGPRNMVHSWATETDDPTEMPRWGKIGKQKIKDAGTLYPKRMETVDDEIRDHAVRFMEAAQKANKPFFVWLNPTRMHIVTHLSPKWQGTRNSQNGWSIQEAGMAQLDNDIGIVLQKLKDMGEEDNTIVVFTTDNGTELFTWPDGGTTPFAQCKGTIFEGGFRVPCIARWPGHIPADTVQNGLMSGLDWFPTFLAAAGNTSITGDLLKGVKIGDRTYKNHLDGYNQMNLITGKGPSNRNEIFYLGESTVGAVRIGDYKFRFIDQPNGWLGEKTKPDVPYITNLRLDPFERMGWPNNGTKEGAQQYFGWFKYEFWRFVFVQQVMGKALQTFIDYPPMQRGASFNLDAVKAEMAKRMAQAEAASKGPGH